MENVPKRVRRASVDVSNGKIPPQMPSRIRSKTDGGNSPGADLRRIRSSRGSRDFDEEGLAIRRDRSSSIILQNKAMAGVKQAALAAVKMKSAAGSGSGDGAVRRDGDGVGGTHNSEDKAEDKAGGGLKKTGRDETALSPLQSNRQLAEMNASLDQRRASLEEMVMGMTPQQVDDLVHAKVQAAGGGRQPSMIVPQDSSPTRRRSSMTPSEKVKEIMLAQKESGIHPEARRASTSIRQSIDSKVVGEGDSASVRRGSTLADLGGATHRASLIGEDQMATADPGAGGASGKSRRMTTAGRRKSVSERRGSVVQPGSGYKDGRRQSVVGAGGTGAGRRQSVAAGGRRMSKAGLPDDGSDTNPAASGIAQLLLHNANENLKEERDIAELAKESELEINPFTKAQFSMIVTKEDIQYYTESLSPHEKRVCIHFVRHWMERNRKQNQVRLNKALSQWMIATGKQAQNDEKRLRQDMALLTLRLQPPGYRTEKDIRAISEWLLKDRIIQGVASLHTIYMRKLCQEIQLRTMEKNTLLFCQGEVGKEFLVILHGAVDLFVQFSKRKEMNVLWCHSDEYFEAFPTHEVRRDYLSGYLGQLLMTLSQPKTEFGEMSLLSKGGVRNTSAVVSEQSTLLIVPDAVYQVTLRRAHAEKLEHQAKMDFLRGCVICDGWREAMISQVSYMLVRRNYPRQTVIVRSGDSIDVVRIVVAGEVGSIAGEFTPVGHSRPGYLPNVEYRREGRGTIIGDIDINNGSKVHSTTLIASTTVTTYEMPIFEYRQIFANRSVTNPKHEANMKSRQEYDMVHRAAEVTKRKGAQKEEEALARLQRKDPAELSSHKKKQKASIYKLPTGHSQYHPEPVVHEVYVDPRSRETHPITTGFGIDGNGPPGPQWVAPAANLGGVGRKSREPTEKERERRKEKERIAPSTKAKSKELMGVDNKKIPDWQVEQGIPMYKLRPASKDAKRTMIERHVEHTAKGLTAQTQGPVPDADDEESKASTMSHDTYSHKGPRVSSKEHLKMHAVKDHRALHGHKLPRPHLAPYFVGRPLKVEDELQKKKEEEADRARKAERPEATLDGRWNTEEERNRIFWQEARSKKKSSFEYLKVKNFGGQRPKQPISRPKSAMAGLQRAPTTSDRPKSASGAGRVADVKSYAPRRGFT